MRGPGFALKALRRRMLCHASGTNAACFKRVPLEPASAIPLVFSLRLPTAKGTANLRSGYARVRLVLLFCAGLSGKNVSSRFHHNRLFAGQWFRHS